MAQDADGTAPTAVLEGLDHGEFQISGSERDDLFAGTIAVADHAIEIDGEEVGLHGLEQGGEAVDLVVGVVEIVDDADVGVAGGAKAGDDGELVGGFAEPTQMIVESDGRTDAGGFGAERAEGGDGAGDLPFQGGGIGFRLCSESDPELWGQFVAGEAIEDGVGFGSEIRWKPPRGEFDLPGGKFGDLAVEGRDVFGSPVVGEALDAERLQHGGTLPGGALDGVEGDDAPGDEIGTGEETVWGEGGAGGLGRDKGRGKDEGGEETRHGEAAHHARHGVQSQAKRAAALQRVCSSELFGVVDDEVGVLCEGNPDLAFELEDALAQGVRVGGSGER